MDPLNAKVPYQKTKAATKEYYLQIQKVWCPALDSYINFNRSGFRHLIWKKSDQRTKREQQRRFFVLPGARVVLQSHDAKIIFYREKDSTRFWAFPGMYDGKAIKVIVRQIDKKQKHFFSVFEDKKKSTQ